MIQAVVIVRTVWMGLPGQASRQMTMGWIVYGQAGLAGLGPVPEAGGGRRLSMVHVEEAVAEA